MLGMLKTQDNRGAHILPAWIRPAVLASFALLLLMGLAGLLWRGPAILLDLAALSNALWCF